MKGNWGKILMIALPIVVAIGLLFPTWRANSIIGEEEQYIAAKDTVGLIQYRKDHGEDLKNAKTNRLKLGLDLRGGMYVTLEVDAVKLLEESAESSSKDELFDQVIEKTRQETEAGDVDVMEAFQRNFKAIAGAKGKSLVSYYDIGNSTDLSEKAITDKLQRDIDEAIDQALQVIQTRVDGLGVSEANIQKQGTRRIVVEMPGANDPEAVRSLLGGTARLEFKLLRSDVSLVRAFYNIDQYLARQKSDKAATPAPAVATADTTKKDTSSVAAKADTTKKDTAASSAKPKDPYAGLSQEEASKRFKADHPFVSLFSTSLTVNERSQDVSGIYLQAPDTYPEGRYTFYVSESNKEILKALLNRADIKRLLPGDIDVALEAKPLRGTGKNGQEGVFMMLGLKKEPELTGEAVSDARENFDPSSNQPVVYLQMNSEGTDRWAKVTRANVKNQIAIVMDGLIYSAPTVNEPITGGSSQITGMANIEEAKLLRIALKAGALKAPVRIIEERVVGPSLGEDSIRYGLTAAAIAFALVILFMLMYYSTAGVVANIAVIVNVLLLIASVAGFNGTLSLPGIAGIILTIGMAVDANILIYERVREEIYRGRTLKAAIDEGFKHALTAIIDSNVTTFITGLILFIMGTGPIQGFALTLMIGIATTLITAIWVSRAIIELWIGSGRSIHFGQHPTMKMS